MRCFTQKRDLLILLFELSTDRVLRGLLFIKVFDILYINNLPLPHNPEIPLLLRYTTLCLSVGTVKQGAEYSQLIPVFLPEAFVVT